MAESIRSIVPFVLEVDTNKRTIHRIISADSLDELKEEVVKAIDDIKEEVS